MGADTLNLSYSIPKKQVHNQYFGRSDLDFLYNKKAKDGLLNIPKTLK
jgi:hypothetical protein